VPAQDRSSQDAAGAAGVTDRLLPTGGEEPLRTGQGRVGRGLQSGEIRH